MCFLNVSCIHVLSFGMVEIWMVIDSAKLYILVQVEVTLALSQSHKGARKQHFFMPVVSHSS